MMMTEMAKKELEQNINGQRVQQRTRRGTGRSRNSNSNSCSNRKSDILQGEHQNLHIV